MTLELNLLESFVKKKIEVILLAVVEVNNGPDYLHRSFVLIAQKFVALERRNSGLLNTGLINIRNDSLCHLQLHNSTILTKLIAKLFSTKIFLSTAARQKLNMKVVTSK